MKNAIVKVDELVLDKEVYPRMKESWVTAYGYAQAMKVGEKFPPIIVANFKRKKYLIDGWHRVQGYKLNGVEYTEAEVIKVSDKKEMYIEAVKRNVTHGRPFSFQEKLGIVDNLEKLKVDKETISHIVGITIDKIEKFKVERVTHTISGKTVFLKSPVKHLADQKIENGELDTFDKITGVRSQIQLLEMVISMLENKVFDLDKKEITEKLGELHNILDKTIIHA